MSTHETDVVDVDRQTRIRHLVEEVIRRRASGESLTDAQLCQDHSGLLPELAAELRKLQIIQIGREQSERGADETVTLPTTRQARRLARSLRIRCPLCHEPLEIATDQSLDDVQCAACQGRFSLAGDDAELKGQQPVTRIAHFELQTRLGMGGFGTVWKAQDTKLERTVALKIPRRGQLSAQQVEEFLYEARVAAKLRHPYIVTVHEIGREGDEVYIVSDLVEGMSLDKYKAARQLTHREAAELMASICDALHFAHEKGVVHRDLKPGNILIDSAGRPHVTDFGLAKRAREEVEITAQGEILGTPAYMSPEQARGEAHLADGRTDVYSLGVMLFELLTDYQPFRGNVLMLTHHAIHTEPPSPRRLNATVSADLETICLKCLEKDPNRRYASAKELGEELRRYLAGDAILARPIGRAERLWRWSRKNPRIPALSAALLAVVLTAYVLAWLWFERSYASFDRSLTERALDNVAFTANSIADTAGGDFEQHFDVVENAARQPELIARMRNLLADDELRPLREQLCDISRQDKIDAETVALRRQLEDHSLCQAIQKWTENFAGDLSVFATLVVLSDGLQVARHPPDNATGKNYIWRTYVNGHAGDELKTRRPMEPSNPNNHLQATFLSPPFVSDTSDAWVLVISTPVWDDRGGQKDFLGVFGVMVKLGSLTQLPGNAQRDRASTANGGSFAVLAHTRDNSRLGRIVQHPLYSELDEEPPAEGVDSPRRDALNRSQSEPALQVPLDGWTVNANYRDPLAGVSNKYDQRWLAGQLPVQVRGRDTGLRVIVQESYDQMIGQPLAHMRRGLILLSLITFGLSAAVIVPLWGLILRLVR